MRGSTDARRVTKITGIGDGGRRGAFRQFKGGAQLGAWLWIPADRTSACARRAIASASRARAKSRTASSAASGTRTAVRSPERDRRASIIASRRFTRSPGRLGIDGRHDLAADALHVQMPPDHETAGPAS